MKCFFLSILLPITLLNFSQASEDSAFTRSNSPLFQSVGYEDHYSATVGGEYAGDLSMVMADINSAELDVPSDVSVLKRVIDKFIRKNEQFSYGLESIEGLYNTSDPASFYPEITPSACWRKFLTCAGVTAGAACNVVKCLSLYNLDISAFGVILIASNIARATFNGIGARVRTAQHNSFLETLNIFHCSPYSTSRLTSICAQASEVGIEKVLMVANSIIDIAKRNSLNNGWEQKCARLAYLSAQLTPPGVWSRLFAFCGRGLSFTTGVTAGMAIAIKGQEAPISYWLTLISGGVDPVVDGLSTADGSTSKIRQYIMTCEVLFLCDDFLKTVANDQFTV